MRVAECTGITKSDINLSENTISVNHNLIYRVIDGKAGFHITTPKTESGTRIIPILYPEVAEQLRLQIETIDALYPDDQLVLGGCLLYTSACLHSRRLRSMQHLGMACQ